jgi:AAA15 family ATPase/GTPase
MIDRLIAKNFRCFESLDLPDLTRINVIVGDNASGKTALLEAIFFGAGAARSWPADFASCAVSI